MAISWLLGSALSIDGLAELKKEADAVTSAFDLALPIVLAER